MDSLFASARVTGSYHRLRLVREEVSFRVRCAGASFDFVSLLAVLRLAITLQPSIRGISSRILAEMA